MDTWISGQTFLDNETHPPRRARGGGYRHKDGYKGTHMEGSNVKTSRYYPVEEIESPPSPTWQDKSRTRV